MIRIAVLGDIGSGKSYVAKQFGYPVFSADADTVTGNTYLTNLTVWSNLW